MIFVKRLYRETHCLYFSCNFHCSDPYFRLPITQLPKWKMKMRWSLTYQLSTDFPRCFLPLKISRKNELTTFKDLENRNWKDFIIYYLKIKRGWKSLYHLHFGNHTILYFCFLLQSRFSILPSAFALQLADTCLHNSFIFILVVCRLIDLSTASLLRLFLISLHNRWLLFCERFP